MSSKFIVKSYFFEKCIFCEKIILNFEISRPKWKFFKKMCFFEKNQMYRSQRLSVFVFRPIVHLKALDEFFLDMIQINSRPQTPLVSTTIEEGFRIENPSFQKTPVFERIYDISYVCPVKVLFKIILTKVFSLTYDYISSKCTVLMHSKTHEVHIGEE